MFQSNEACGIIFQISIDSFKLKSDVLVSGHYFKLILEYNTSHVTSN